ncbi:unnamed protein product [Didymodactylos carnosus]|uniref:Uncharacterized protein n=1 Tax=Didymodactylos carnosus TaxID=1234261 RepID=A0A8S2X1Z0_9BILA|nr:unnamed protein product [Didymodactylos carnosus]
MRNITNLGGNDDNSINNYSTDNNYNTPDDNEGDTITNVANGNTQNSIHAAPVTRPPCLKRCLNGVIFVTDDELQHEDKQRDLYPKMSWDPDTEQSSSLALGRPCSIWWSVDRRKWLRAICTNNIYGLLCCVCAQYSADNISIQRAHGSFVVKPYYKLGKKGIAGIMSHEKSEMHKKSIDISNEQLTRNGNNTIAAILNTVNMKDTTKDYLRALARTFLFVLSQEFAFFSFEDLIKLQASNLSKLITT